MKQINGDNYIDITKLQMTQEEIRKALQEEGISAMKDMLDKQYIEELSVSDENIKLLQNEYKQNGNYDKDIKYNLNINEISQTDIQSNISLILVSATLNNKDLQMIVKLDQANNTYSIFLGDYIKKYDYKKDMDKNNININTSSIDANSYNSKINIDPSESYIVSQYFSEYRMKMIYDTKKAYELLHEEYKKKKYGSYEMFVEYINNNKNDILYASISKYQVLEHEGIKEYVCIDKNGKYYIFNESNITDYNVILDTYTVDLPEFIDKYDNNEGEIKSGMNIEKIFTAINDGDYRYVYAKLDDAFKQNNFPTEESFEKYIKQYFINNQLEHNDCKKSGELYIYDITVSEGTENNKQAVKKTFIIKLLEGRDFIFSFNVQ